MSTFGAVARQAGWIWFCAWAFSGGLTFFAVLTGFSIGLLLLPFGALSVVLVARWARAWPESLGVVAGVGAICLLIAALNRDYRPCPRAEVTLSPGQSEFSCGGLDPKAWWIAGALLLPAASVAYEITRRLLGRPLGA
jgi:hypothetical protein